MAYHFETVKLDKGMYSEAGRSFTGVLEKCDELRADLKQAGIRVKVDTRDTVSAGFKFNDWELKGVPLRLEVGPRDLENGVVTVFRRDTLEKFTVPLDGITEKLGGLLDEIQKTLYEQARAFRDEQIGRASCRERVFLTV